MFQWLISIHSASLAPKQIDGKMFTIFSVVKHFNVKFSGNYNLLGGSDNLFDINYNLLGGSDNLLDGIVYPTVSFGMIASCATRKINEKHGTHQKSYACLGLRKK